MDINLAPIGNPKIFFVGRIAFMERSFTTSSPGPPRRGGFGHLMSSLGNRTETRDTAMKGVDDKILKN